MQSGFYLEYGTWRQERAPHGSRRKCHVAVGESVERVTRGGMRKRVCHVEAGENATWRQEIVPRAGRSNFHVEAQRIPRANMGIGATYPAARTSVVLSSRI